MPVDIKGKEYITVNERILEFRDTYCDNDYSLVSEMLSNEGGVCIFKASIYKGDYLVATGHAYEKEGSTFINKTSYIENCETSAWGRALANLGIGIDVSVASADEVGNAVKQQKEANPQPPKGFKPPTDDQKLQMKEMLVDAGKAVNGKFLTAKDAKKWGLTELDTVQFQARYEELISQFAEEGMNE